MTLKIIHKNNTSAGQAPAPSDLDIGEIAVNSADAQLYVKDNDGAIQSFTNDNDAVTVQQFTQAGSGAVQRTVQAKLREVMVSVKDFGAVGDGVADDTAAIQAALDFVFSNGRGTVFIPSGTYRTTATITLIGLSVCLEGAAGEFSTILRADFVGGPVLRIGSSRRTRVSNLEINSFATRQSTGTIADIGLFIDPGDTGSNRVTHSVFENLVIQDQPGHGFVHLGASWDCLYSRIIAVRCGGHGFMFDDGSSFGYTSNLQLPGICRLEFCESADNDGHSLIIGNDNLISNRGLRFVIESCDFYRCAQATGIRKAATSIWIFGELCLINSCAINGSNKAGTSAVNSLIYIHGRSNTISNCRLLDSANPSAIYVGGTIAGYDTNGILIQNNQIIDGFATMALNPLVNVDPAASNVEVSNLNPNEISGLKDLTNNKSQYATIQQVYQLVDQTVNNSTTLVSATDLNIPLFAHQRATFKAQLFFAGDASADIRFALGTPTGSTSWYTTTGNIRLNSGDVVSSNDVTTVGGLFLVGTAGATIRTCEISGFVQTAGISGSLSVRFAQGTAVITNTTLLANSSLTLIS